MRTLMLTTVVLVMGSLGSLARADDGSWNRTYDLAQGPLYSVVENPDIALEKELLILQDFVAGTVTARFELKNTSDRAVTLDAGFPVVLDPQLDKGFELGQGKLRSEEQKGAQPVYVMPSDKVGEIDPGLLRAAGLEVRKRLDYRDDDDYEMGLSDYYIRVADFPKKRLERPVPKKPPFDFTIDQDGKPVALTSMVVELDPEARPPIIFHFRHQLTFAPGAASVVTVRYRAPTLFGGWIDRTSMSQFEWHYVLHTGATWKGPLGKLVLAVPFGGVCDGEEKWTRLGKWGGYQLYRWVDFEPTTKDDLRCRWYRSEDEPDSWDRWWFEEDESGADGGRGRKVSTWDQARQPATGVRGIRASSSVDHRADVYTDWGVVKNAPNSAEAAFDGLVETAWSEGDKKADAGQYLEFELTRPAAGLRIMGGFLGALHPVSGDLAGKKQQTLLSGLYHDNSRPKTLELSAIDGSRKWTLELADRRGEWNVFPILVPAGKYRLVIQKTYRGKKWQDTSIGEVVFDARTLCLTASMTGLTTCLAGLRKDRFFGRYFADGAPYLHPFVSAPPQIANDPEEEP